MRQTRILGVSGTVSGLGSGEWQLLHRYGLRSWNSMPSVYGESNFRYSATGNIHHQCPKCMKPTMLEQGWCILFPRPSLRAMPPMNAMNANKIIKAAVERQGRAKGHLDVVRYLVAERMALLACLKTKVATAGLSLQHGRRTFVRSNAADEGDDHRRRRRFYGGWLCARVVVVYGTRSSSSCMEQDLRGSE